MVNLDKLAQRAKALDPDNKEINGLKTKLLDAQRQIDLLKERNGDLANKLAEASRKYQQYESRIADLDRYIAGSTTDDTDAETQEMIPEGSVVIRRSRLKERLREARDAENSAEAFTTLYGEVVSLLEDLQKKPAPNKLADLIGILKDTIKEN